jgi:hypothetical protein
MKTRYFLLGMVLATAATAQTTVFQQNFEGVVAPLSIPDVVSIITPNTDKFTEIIATGSASALIENGTLKFVRPANSCRFTRSVDFAPAPTSLYIQFDFSATGNEDRQTAAQFRVGSFSDGSAVTNGETYARFGINIFQRGGFQLRDMVGGTNLGSITNGVQRITMVLNKKGFTFNYFAPNDTWQTLAKDKVDLWVGDVLVGNDLNITTVTQPITDIKLIYDQGNGEMTFDNFLIRTVEGAGVDATGAPTGLPVQLLNFTASANPDQAVDVRWSTGSEQNSSHFVLERSASLESFAEIARLDAAGQASSVRQYSFTDRNPLRGINYYRLRQIDTDGSQQLYRPVAVEIGGDVLRVFPNPSSTGEFVLQGPDSQMASIELLSAIGTKIALEHEICSNQERKLRLPAGTPAGMYVLKLLRANGTATHLKVVLR